MKCVSKYDILLQEYINYFRSKKGEFEAMKYENDTEVLAKKQELKDCIDNICPYTILRMIGAQKHYKDLYSTQELMQLLLEYFSNGIFQFNLKEKEGSLDLILHKEEK